MLARSPFHLLLLPEEDEGAGGGDRWIWRDSKELEKVTLASPRQPDTPFQYSCTAAAGLGLVKALVRGRVGHGELEGGEPFHTTPTPSAPTDEELVVEEDEFRRETTRGIWKPTRLFTGCRHKP
ncbi:Hypothetical protein SMAX5B_009110 [Scophthalmus maximus]|uniref:Uncharacterized protein n=1 Tax=Scophthalmus maximus TaxID=52904 RepID=A0A2U9CHP0_SCOMX|nr:Hypothetical protein SMAX5B_009110 [Scophthalmus maximus]